MRFFLRFVVQKLLWEAKVALSQHTKKKKKKMVKALKVAVNLASTNYISQGTVSLTELFRQGEPLQQTFPSDM